jgi:hypothetical protein
MSAKSTCFLFGADARAYDLGAPGDAACAHAAKLAGATAFGTSTARSGVVVHSLTFPRGINLDSETKGRIVGSWRRRRRAP